MSPIQPAAARRRHPLDQVEERRLVDQLDLGPGGGARFAIGLVVASGMTIGTLFTLFVVPAFYLYIARDHGHGDNEAYVPPSVVQPH